MCRPGTGRQVSMHGRHATTLDPRLFGCLSMSRGGHGHRRAGGRHGRQQYGFPGFGPPRGPRARRGDVRAALLVLLAEEPRNGYQLMQEIEERSGGVWRPSPGSVYPALQQLEDEGLVRVEQREGGKAYALTDEGRAHVEARSDQLGAPWDAVRGDMGEGAWELDRKSTRLNSSHLVISYAVFCLKKNIRNSVTSATVNTT